MKAAEAVRLNMPDLDQLFPGEPDYYGGSPYWSDTTYLQPGDIDPYTGIAYEDSYIDGWNEMARDTRSVPS